MSKTKISRIIQEWRVKMKELENRLVTKYGEKILGSGGFGYSVDEEDGFLEYVSWGNGTHSDFANSDEKLLRLLRFWSNDRECFPVEFVREMLKEAMRGE